MVCAISVNQLTSEGLIWFDVIASNLVFFHIYILVETIFITFVFSALMKSVVFNSVSRILLGGFILFYWAQIFRNEGMNHYPTYTHFVESLLVLFYAGSYFLKTFKEGRAINLLKESGFWISTGTLVYFSSNCLLFLFNKFVSDLSANSFILIYTVHAFLTILLYIAYTIAIQCKTNHSLS